QSIHRIWHENIIFRKNEEAIIGKNDQTIVTEANGKQWQTSSVGIFYFPINKWYNIVIVFENKDDYFYYCNIASPIREEAGVLSYIDYDIDIIVESDYTYEIVDEAEYKTHQKKYGYSHMIDVNVRASIREIKKRIQKRQAPFNE